MSLGRSPAFSASVNSSTRACFVLLAGATGLEPRRTAAAFVSLRRTIPVLTSADTGTRCGTLAAKSNSCLFTAKSRTAKLPVPRAILGYPLSRGVATCMAAAASAEGGRSTGGSTTLENREILVQHLLLPEDQLQQLLKLQTRIIQEGVDLSDLATEFSICPSKKEGGMLGWITLGQTVPEFESAAFSAPLNKLVRVQTKFGWHLLQVISEREGAVVRQLEVEQLGVRLQEVAESNNAEGVQLIDVREPSEIEVASIPGFKPYPLSQFGAWAPTIADDLDPSKETIVLCHHGMRSQQAAQWLKSQGFKRLYNVSGGIDAYARKVDASIPLY
eukprot:TRINITY_DN23602_c0_g1_i1.p1 TRINITY_DN23602_c0_g1~~TRINITY_DN23602_c0_g1_i1.p1  ORF type:complete len:331 (+),score=57.81 TRINITY_DN23602_c0_g1_i1:45-1037(+)